MINTLDIDFNDKEKILHMLRRIGENECLLEWRMVYSSSLNGYHITLFCKLEGCERCRIVFDDPIRLSADQRRPEYARNMFFTDKKKLKAGTLEEIIKQLETE